MYLLQRFNAAVKRRFDAFSLDCLDAAMQVSTIEESSQDMHSLFSESVSWVTRFILSSNWGVFAATMTCDAVLKSVVVWVCSLLLERLLIGGCCPTFC